MEVTKTPRTDPAAFNEAEFDRNFKPKGAIAFFVLLVILGLIIWYGIYFLMLARA
ncbi:MAG: cytochrome c oxidase subunit 2A [Chitinophagaceae bacterium]